jgi:small nuclear ribonucleoprotein (snRNP)-like protein
MAKKQKSFADKASGRGADADAVMVKYVKSVKSEKTGFWRFNEQMVKLRDGEDLNAALKRLDEASNLVDIDLSAFEAATKTDDTSSVNNEESKESTVVSDSEGEEE